MAAAAGALRNLAISGANRVRIGGAAGAFAALARVRLG